MPADFYLDLRTGQILRVLERRELWGRKMALVLQPDSGQATWVPDAFLGPLQEDFLIRNQHYLKYLVAACQVGDAMTQDQLLSPLEASVIPLPHQLNALNRVVQAQEVRFLLADEVGLGKTIEAGLILRELKLRGRVRRTLIVVPAGLMRQWQSELEMHFNEDFLLLEKIRDSSVAFWLAHSQVICSLDAIKPVKSNHNSHLEGLLEAGWDLVIFDEAHRLGGSSSSVARYQLGKALSESVPDLLLLSATPHQGNSEAFARLLSLLDPQLTARQALNVAEVRPRVIRTEKRLALDAQGQPLFQPRLTEAVVVPFSSDAHRQLYEAVSQYVRKGYDQAIKENRSGLGFLLSLMQRLVTSSTRAICTTLEKRLTEIQPGGEQMALFAGFAKGDTSWHELDSQSLLDLWMDAGQDRDEKREVQLLLQMARECSLQTDDKARMLYDLILRLRREEQTHHLKVLIFTEFIATQDMLEAYLSAQNLNVLTLNGAMNNRQRQRIQQAFAHDFEVLISTDAGGEGLNLQFCHIVINYDVPWNPMKLEQRIGRVDRIGQTHPVRAFNFFLADTVENRVREVLEEKLGTILAEFGVDKTADVLDSAEAGEWFDALYVESLLQPELLERKADELVSKLREQAKQKQDATGILATQDRPDPELAQRVMDSPVQTWIERMVISWLRSQDCEAGTTGQNIWQLEWPDPDKSEPALKQVVFTAKDFLRHPEAQYLTLENPQVRQLLNQIPAWLPGQGIPVIQLQDWNIPGYWSLWEVRSELFKRENWRQRRLFSLFTSPDYKPLIPTASRIWSEFHQKFKDHVQTLLEPEESERIYARLFALAEAQGQGHWQVLENEHQTRLKHERRRAEASWRFRERQLKSIQDPDQQLLARERLKKSRQEQEESLRQQEELIPCLEARLMVKIV